MIGQSLCPSVHSIPGPLVEMVFTNTKALRNTNTLGSHRQMETMREAARKSARKMASSDELLSECHKLLKPRRSKEEDEE